MLKLRNTVILYILFLGVLTALPFGNARAADFYVIDGDTFFLKGRTYRLWGIDAPEKDQFCSLESLDYHCGAKARNYLKSLITPAEVKCEAKPRSKKETRTVALCRVNGEDLAQLMVSAGWAVDYEFFSEGYYAREEKAARESKRGLWAGDFQPPKEWRKAHSR